MSIEHWYVVLYHHFAQARCFSHSICLWNEKQHRYCSKQRLTISPSSVAHLSSLLIPWLLGDHGVSTSLTPCYFQSQSAMNVPSSALGASEVLGLPPFWTPLDNLGSSLFASNCSLPRSCLQIESFQIGVVNPPWSCPKRPSFPCWFVQTIYTIVSRHPLDSRIRFAHSLCSDSLLLKYCSALSNQLIGSSSLSLGKSICILLSRWSRGRSVRWLKMDSLDSVLEPSVWSSSSS